MSAPDPRPSPIVAVTRATPGPVEIPGADVRQLGDGLPTRDEVLEVVRGAAVVISMYTDRVDEGFLRAAGPGLRGVCNHAVGVNNIDLDACRAAGVRVTNTPDAVTEGTANIALLLMLAVARRLTEAQAFVRTGDWERHGPLGMHEFLGLDLCGKTLLVVGAGRIGYATALRAKALGMRVEYVARSRHIEFEIAPLDARRVELDEAVGRADVVTIHTPLTPETTHILSAERIGRLKPTAIVVNTSRGPTVDEAALAEACAQRRIWGAGLDVFEREPAVDQRLMGLDNVVLTPHIGSAEIRWRAAMTAMCVENAVAILEGREPPNRVA
jgi:glyoxylate reductase